jgi:hypothetical protein
MTGKPVPMKRHRKRILLPPDPPLPGANGVWPDRIATVRPLPAGPLDGRQPQVLWIDDSPFAPLAAIAIWFNEEARASGYPLAIVLYRNHFDIVEFERGAIDHAERTDRGPIGQFLRVLGRYGGFSKADSAIDHAIGIRRSIQHNDSAMVASNERAVRLAPPTKPSFVGIARRGIGWIDRSLRSDSNPDSRLISVGDPALPLAPNPNHPLAKPLGPMTVQPKAQFERSFNYVWPDPVKTRVQRPISNRGGRRKAKGQ